MADLSLADGVLSLSEFRAQLTERLDSLGRGSSCLVITRKGRAAAVVMSPEEFDRLQYGAFVRAKLAKGRTGRKHAHRDVMVEARKAARGSKQKAD